MNTPETIQATTPTAEQIQKVVAEFYHMTPEEMLANKRTAAIAFARQLGMYLMRELTDAPFHAIAVAFGRTDHGTALHAHSVVCMRMSYDASLRTVVAALRAKLISA